MQVATITDVVKRLDEIIAWSLVYIKEEIPAGTIEHFVNEHPEFIRDLSWMGPGQAYPV